jgi:clan AA aspartic protease (TIGR02281 family)
MFNAPALALLRGCTKGVPLHRIASWLAGSALMLLCNWGAALALEDDGEPSPSLSEQLTELAEQHRFEVSGLQILHLAPPEEVEGDLFQRVSMMLSEYNHVIVKSAGGGISRVIIVSKKAPAPDVQVAPDPAEDSDEDNAGDPVVVNTQRRGNLHLVETSLVGSSGKELKMQLVIDTGATHLVLPHSKGGDLGLQIDDLQEREVRTAKGSVNARVGRVSEIKLGGEVVKDVEVAFIQDELLGENQLLGMNVLGRFRITLDDDNNTLTLNPRESGKRQSPP